jgi:hypothetical protein
LHEKRTLDFKEAKADSTIVTKETEHGTFLLTSKKKAVRAAFVAGWSTI